MFQLELYVRGVETAEKLFTEAFGFITTENKDGWRFLHHPQNFDIMLFDPGIIKEEDERWPVKETYGGEGIQIVICVDDIARRREIVAGLGYACSALYYPPWGSTEFTFHLQEGYLIRVKQPKADMA